MLQQFLSIACLLFQQIWSQPPPPITWPQWSNELQQQSYYSLIKGDEKFPERLENVCNTFFFSEESARHCYDYYLREAEIFLSSRLEDPLIPVRVRTVACPPLNFHIDAGLTLSIVLDRHDDAHQVSSAIALFANISKTTFFNTVDIWTPVFEKAVQESPQFCSEAELRRTRHANAVIGVTESQVVYLSPSSVRCESPYHHNEWLSDQGKGYLPLGSCRYENLYVHNNQWYFVSDTRSGAPEHGVRLNTLCRYPATDSAVFKPKHVTMDQLKNLISESGPMRPASRTVRTYENSLFLVDRLVTANHGHMLYDVVIPILWSLQLLKEPSTDIDDLLTDDFRVVLMDSELSDAKDDRIRIITPNVSPVYNTLSPFGNVCEPGVWCVYKDVYAGVGGMGVDHHPTQFRDRYEIYKLFRKRAATVLGYSLTDLHQDFLKPTSETPRRLSVVIIQRLDDRAFSSDAMAMMKALIISLNPETMVDIKYVDETSLFEQAMMMQTASVVIAVDGAAVDNALFMPECGGLLIIGRDILRPQSFEMPHGFLMHETHFDLWKQWLSIELISSPDGSWAEILPSGVAAGPLGQLPFDGRLQSEFISRFDSVVQKREQCALRYSGSNHGSRDYNFNGECSIRAQHCPLSTRTDSACCFNPLQSRLESCCQPHRVDADLMVCGDTHVMTAQNNSAYFVRRRRYIPVVREETDHVYMKPVMARIQLAELVDSMSGTDRSHWYSFSDFSSQQFSSSSPFLHNFHDLLKPYTKALFLKKSVLVYNAYDAYIPMLAIMKGVLQLEVRVSEGSAAVEGISRAIGTISSKFSDSCRDGIVIFDSPGRAEQAADTVIVLLSIHDILYCPQPLDGSSTYSTVIGNLAQQTKSTLLLEFHPQEPSRSCQNCIREDVRSLENALREHFTMFQIIGVVKDNSSSGSFLYMAEGPTGREISALAAHTIQSIIINPQENSEFRLNDEGVALVSVQAILSGPALLLQELYSHVQSLQKDRNASHSVGAGRAHEGKLSYLIPRLFVGPTVSGVAESKLQKLGGAYLLTYEIPIYSPGEHLITLQIVKNTKQYIKHSDIGGTVSERSCHALRSRQWILAFFKSKN